MCSIIKSQRGVPLRHYYCNNEKIIKTTPKCCLLSKLILVPSHLTNKGLHLMTYELVPVITTDYDDYPLRVLSLSLVCQGTNGHTYVCSFLTTDKSVMAGDPAIDFGFRK